MSSAKGSPNSQPLAQVVVAYAVNRSGRHSILVVVLAVLFVLATGAAAVSAALAIVGVVQHPDSMFALRPACAVSRD